MEVDDPIESAKTAINMMASNMVEMFKVRGYLDFRDALEYISEMVYSSREDAENFLQKEFQDSTNCHRTRRDLDLLSCLFTGNFDELRNNLLAVIEEFEGRHYGSFYHNLLESINHFELYNTEFLSNEFRSSLLGHLCGYYEGAKEILDEFAPKQEELQSQVMI